MFKPALGLGIGQRYTMIPRINPLKAMCWYQAKSCTAAHLHYDPLRGVLQASRSRPCKLSPPKPGSIGYKTLSNTR